MDDLNWYLFDPGKDAVEVEIVNHVVAPSCAFDAQLRRCPGSARGGFDLKCRSGSPSVDLETLGYEFELEDGDNGYCFDGQSLCKPPKRMMAEEAFLHYGRTFELVPFSYFHDQRKKFVSREEAERLKMCAVARFDAERRVTRYYIPKEGRGKAKGDFGQPMRRRPLSVWQKEELRKFKERLQLACEEWYRLRQEYKSRLAWEIVAKKVKGLKGRAVSGNYIEKRCREYGIKPRKS